MRMVTVEAPISSRMAPKLGTDSAIKSRTSTEKLLKTHLLQFRSDGIWRSFSKNWAGGFVMMGKVVMRWRSSMTSTTILCQPLDMASTMLSVTLSPREK